MTDRRSWSTTLAWWGLALVLLVPVWWGADATLPWDSDNLAPGSVLKGLAAHFGPGWYSVYGPLPYYLMGAAYLPVLGALKFAGELGTPSPIYPFGFAHPDVAIAILVTTARLTTVLLALGTAWLAARRVRRFEPNTAGWVVPVLFMGSAQFAFYGRTSNVDVHALFWLFLALTLVESRRASLAPLLGAAAAVACAVCSKEQAGPMAAPLLLAAAWKAFHRPATTGRRLLAVAAVGAAALLAYALLWQLPFNLTGWRAHHEFLFAEALGGRKYPLTPGGLAGLALQCAEYAPLAFGLPVLLGLALALARRVSVHGLGWCAFVALVYAGGFIGRVGYVFPRFLLPLLVLAIPLAARGFTHAPRRRPTLAALVVLLAMSGGPLVSWLMLTDPRLAAERWIRAHVPAGATLELSGNGHINLRPPHGYEVTRVTEKTLFGGLQPPVGDVVAISSIDTFLLVRDPRIKAAWWDVVHAAPPDGPYRVAARFPRPPAAEWLGPMWIAPGITLYQRAAPPVTPTP